ncbi:hypothetical protein GN244_ATG20984 [Phytophthora infestans]|uniref:Secreted RxLR effector peptide protein n=1 Tax=Phytophthora infestans TaxID=4787 RepID=A0A833RX72_PHYIN|nr:hypothetical protein GN244_ATG20984 [Phytophthora infestans]
MRCAGKDTTTAAAGAALLLLLHLLLIRLALAFGFHAEHGRAIDGGSEQSEGSEYSGEKLHRRGVEYSSVGCVGGALPKANRKVRSEIEMDQKLQRESRGPRR